MRIAVNTRLLIPKKLEGIGWFTYETLKQITNKHKEHEFFFIFDRKYSDEFIFSDNITPIVVSPQARHPFLYFTWFEYSIPKILKKINANFFFSPDGYLSLSSDVPSMPVIHDINFAHRPMDLPFWHRKYYNYFFPRFAQKAVRIATVSEYSKTDLCNTYNIDNKKIDVVYNGANKLYKPLNDDKIQQIRNDISGGLPYFIFVGSLHPRKNIIGMLKAYDLFRKKNKNNKVKLLIVGSAMFQSGDIVKIYKSLTHSSDIIFTGRLSPEKLHNIMASALALVFVPFFEGFGIPVLEAMYCNVPVIASNVTSIPEVGGNAALYTNPHNPEDIAAAMQKIFLNEKLRLSLIEKGIEQSCKFSWDNTANKLWNSIAQVLP